MNVSNQRCYYFFYDSVGVTGFLLSVGSTVTELYRYIRDSFNNIVYIADSSGNPLVKYNYDPWGKYEVQVLTNDSINSQNYFSIFNLANESPFKYRGYIYDNDLGLYYLFARFYDPITRNFINRDNYSYLDISSSTGINLYCYCEYNPIAYVDEDGHLGVAATAILSMVIGAFVSAGIETGKQLVQNEGDFSKLKWIPIVSSALIGGALGFAGGAGGLTLGAILAETGKATVGMTWAWFGISSGVSFAAGAGTYVLKTIGKNETPKLGNAVLSGFVVSLESAISFWSGALAQQPYFSNKIGNFFAGKFVENVFSQPSVSLFDLLMEHII